MAVHTLKKIQKLMYRWGDKAECRLSNCTNFELDVSDFEKPDHPYTRYDGVVMATKVLWSEDLQ